MTVESGTPIIETLLPPRLPKWRRRVSRAATRGGFTFWDRFLVSTWYTCAVSEARRKYGVSEITDSTLRTFGRRMVFFIKRNMYPEALHTIDTIEQRVAAIKGF